jgi:hypothetical protein
VREITRRAALLNLAGADLAAAGIPASAAAPPPAQCARPAAPALGGRWP